MQHYLPSAYGPIDRGQILSRQGIRDDMRSPGRLLLIVPGMDIDWTLIPDRRAVLQNSPCIVALSVIHCSHGDAQGSTGNPENSMTDNQRITLRSMRAAYNATAAAHSDASMLGDAAAIAYLITAMESIEAAMAAIEAVASDA